MLRVSSPEAGVRLRTKRTRRVRPCCERSATERAPTNALSSTRRSSRGWRRSARWSACAYSTTTAAATFAAIIDAFEAIQELNGYGRRIVIAGVNLSAGYPFDAKWFGCGQSPLCQEVDRLVRSGVVVVVAAGNSGYGTVSTAYTKGWASTLAQTINDPGNANLAITVGSTHRNEPHLYGVSYFSSKRRTGDGHRKPDLVAPGERIISCASAQSRLPATIWNPDGTTATITDQYTHKEDSGTSMAAPPTSRA